MTHAQLRAALASLALTQRGFAAFCGSNERTVRRWCDKTQDIPPWVPVILRLMGARWE